MPDEPTAGELARIGDRLRADMRDGFNSINARLDKLPSSELVTQLVANLEHRVREAESKVARVEKDAENKITRLEDDIKDERKARAADRRLVIGAVLAGVVSVIVTIASPLLTGGT